MALAGWGIFMRGGSLFKSRTVSVIGTCFEGNVPGWDSTGTRQAIRPLGQLDVKNRHSECFTMFALGPYCGI